MSKLRITVVSESEFTVRGHGVHTAFKEMVSGLTGRDDTVVSVNKFWRRADIIHAHTVGAYSLAYLLFKRGSKVISVHIIPDSFVGSLVGAKYWYGLAKWYLRFFYNRADALVAVSAEVKTALEQQLRVKPPVTVVFNTVDKNEYTTTPADKAAARERLGIPPHAFMIVGVGQVQPRKRFDVFGRLAAEHPDWRLVWVGGIPFKALGADSAKMEQLIKTAPANLTTTGVIELPEVKQYYQAADVFLLPSTQENHPLAVVEAAAASLPVVVRDIPEYNSSFGSDILRGDDESFGAIIERLRTDATYRQEAITLSAKLAARFNNDVSSAEFMAIYRGLTDRPTSNSTQPPGKV